jgi:putative ABC transport system permease protein
MAGLLIGIGVGCLALAQQRTPALIVAGTAATALGILLISPLAIRVLAVAGARLPIAARLALRDLARHQARSGAALAAISLALAVPVAIVITASAAEYTADEGNLSDRQLIVRIGAQDHPLVPDRTPAQLSGLQTQVDTFAATLDDPRVIALDMAVDPAAAPETGVDGGEGGRPAVELGVPIGEGQFNTFRLYVASPDVLRYYGLDPGAVDPDTDVLTARTGAGFQFVNLSARESPANTAPLDDAGFSSLPTSLITPTSLQRHGWTPARAGWLIEADRPLTTAQLAEARDMALDVGLTIESRLDQSSLLVLRSAATATGGLLALGVLAMTVGLIRGEAAGDLRVLTATGATGRVRRALTSATAGGLALLGAILGIAGAYAGLTAAYANDIGALSRVPGLHLIVTAVGVPMVAASAGWVLAGREPRSLIRPRFQ